MSEKDENFITFLMKLVKDDNRAALAHLRRGLGKKAGTTMEMFPYIAPFIQSSYRNEENAYFLVASLVGLYPDAKKTERNLGFSLYSIEDKSPSTEKRFVALLNSDEEDLPNHLRQIVSLLKSKEAPINWLRLLEGIKFWTHENRGIQRDWANGFWGNPSTNTENTEKGEQK